jgi:hypothetical protein
MSEERKKKCKEDTEERKKDLTGSTRKPKDREKTLKEMLADQKSELKQMGAKAKANVLDPKAREEWKLAFAGLRDRQTIYGGSRWQKTFGNYSSLRSAFECGKFATSVSGTPGGGGGGGGGASASASAEDEEE